ncbi:MAG: hypothetical protein DI551_06225 [Micavibrio aeruginosavorus]|uniref:DUF1223 domain-containing protein n=1 Tax=Micavibrio aeruginosavorus TaxID=349221 RepID=A0A2W5N0E2_9BACT|nr:MAG: hypothetical protein DI551_06225 [Micavibrio aeruginosavorus]
MIRFITVLAATSLLALPAFAQNAVPPLITAQTAPSSPAVKPPPVVLELFTSQGCAFCPPADALMGQMIQQESVIGLSCHVDYFAVKKNSLGKSFCTKRQGDYNRLIGTGPRYTPQLIVNGHMDLIGSETGKVSAAIIKARAEKLGAITLTPTGGDSYNIALPQINTGNEPVSLWLAVYDAPHSIAITEGNNFGKKITYFNVVSRLSELGTWDGNAMARAVTAGFVPGNGGIAVIAQNPHTGRIIAAGSAPKP